MADNASTTSSTFSGGPQSPIDALTASIDALDGPSGSTGPLASAASPGPSGAAQTDYYPTVRIILRAEHVDPSLRAGAREICRHAPRGNLEWVPEGEEPRRGGAPDEHWWFVRMSRDDSLGPREVSIAPSHSDFTDLPSSHIPSSRLPSSHFTVSVGYRRACEAFRALGHILAQTRHCNPIATDPPDPSSSPPNGASSSSSSSEGDAQTRFEWTGDTALFGRKEECLFETLGVMIDCSRNGVLLVERVEEILRYLALMGCNMLQLYTEDTYEVRGEPFFGYFRGPYKASELKRIDDYADALGIEIIPCIQTLGHLGQMLQWGRFGSMRDTHEVLLARSEEVYSFIEKMIRSVTGPLRTKRIHIGMDEAHGVSEGRFRQIFGYQESTQVFTEHLGRVNDIWKKVGLNPMIWSDMLFCLAAKNNSLGGYYDSANPATPELVEAIPSEIELVYWDYYHTTPQPYANKIRQHWDLSRKPPWMASGIWTWSRFWTALPFTFETVRASMKASKGNSLGVKNALTTIWGDEGNECDIWSSLPGLLYFAEHAYTRNDEVDVALLKRKFDAAIGASFDDYVYSSKLDDLQPENQPIDAKSHFTPNMSKWLLWEEPFYSILSPQYAGQDLETHYGQLALYLDYATSTEPVALSYNMPPQSLKDLPLNARLTLPKLLARILALKCHLRDRLAYAYRTQDWEELQALAGPASNSRTHRLRNLVDELWRYHMSLWMATYKPFGWEVLELRYGGLRARLETMHRRVMAFLDDDDSSVTRLEELEVQTETAYPGSGCMMMLDYHRVSRPTYC